MDKKLFKIPSSLKQMVRLITKSFKSVEESLIIDLLIRYNCLSEKQLRDLLKFDPKTIKAKVQNLKTCKFVKMRTLMERAEDGTPMKVNVYNINYVNVINSVKYKLMVIRQKLENMGKKSNDDPYLWCVNTNCQKTYMLWEIGECFDSETNRFYCTFCKYPAEEILTLHKKDGKVKLAKFNREMSVIFEILQEYDGVSFDSSLMNPLPFTRATQARQTK